MTHLPEIWDCIVSNLPTRRWVVLEDIYTLIERNLNLDTEDYEGQSPSSVATFRRVIFISTIMIGSVTSQGQAVEATTICMTTATKLMSPFKLPEITSRAMIMEPNAISVARSTEIQSLYMTMGNRNTSTTKCKNHLNKSLQRIVYGHG
jgi:hypothetical protein